MRCFLAPTRGAMDLGLFRGGGCAYCDRVSALVATSLLWAFSFGLIKHHLAGVDASFVAFARLALAALLFMPWLRPARVSPSLIVRFAALGAIQFGLMYLLYLSAFQYLQAYQVALLTIVTPIWVCLCEDTLRRAFSWRPIIAALLAVFGAALAIDAPGIGRPPWRGILLIQASNVCFAFGQVWYRCLLQRQPELAERSLFGWLYLGAVAMILPLVVQRLPAELTSLTFGQAMVIVYLGVVASGVGFFLWNFGAARVSAGILAVMNNAKTPLGLLVSLLVFRESVHLGRLLIGGMLVVAATLFAQRTAAVG